jgi:hypothetical protein
MLGTAADQMTSPEHPTWIEAVTSARLKLMAPNDLRNAFRMLARNPGYTLAAVAALALGIVANSAIFSIINTILLKPLTYPDPDRIIQLMNTGPNGT